MRIYVCIPESDQVSIRSELHKALVNFYGYFSPSDIKFFKTSDGSSKVFVMEDSPKPKSNEAIMDAIAKVFSSPVDIKLNYQRLNPNFTPERTAVYALKNGQLGNSGEFDYEQLSLCYHAEEPYHTFAQVVLPAKTRDKIIEAAKMVDEDVRKKVFEEWGLKHIVPHASVALSFYGAPGTGKTMAAEAVASFLQRKIIRATYADIESKFHGEEPKMVKAIFLAAKREDAVLFIDEADSLLSKRLTNVQSGSEQAINSMRSQLLTSLEHFDGVVIFATNLVVNYDRAFISRLISIKIPAPNTEVRRNIWEQHLRGKGICIPLSEDVDTEELAEEYKDFYGREIRKAVVRACSCATINGCGTVTQKDIMTACSKVKEEADELRNASDYTQSILKDALQKKAASTSFV